MGGGETSRQARGERREGDSGRAWVDDGVCCEALMVPVFFITRGCVDVLMMSKAGKEKHCGRGTASRGSGIDEVE